MSYHLLLDVTLLKECCQILQVLPSFKDNASLRRLFEVKELAPYQYLLPDGSNAAERALECVRFLMRYPVSLGADPPLIVFLRVVRTHPQTYALDLTTFDKTYETIHKELQQQLQEKHNDRERERVSREYGVIDGAVADSVMDQVHAWLGLDQLNIADIALKVALVVFDGARFNLFEAAAADLTHRLQSLVEPEQRDAGTGQSVAAPAMRRPNLKQRLTDAGAEIVELRRPDPDGEEVIDKVIKLSNSTHNAGVVQAFWTECIEWHGAVVDWLSSYVQDKPSDVRFRVAIAAGIIALVDFAYARQRIFLRWACIDDAQSRAAVGQALSVVCQNPEKRSDVFVVLRQWSRSANREVRWTAARCLLFVGAYDPGAAIQIWRKIAASEQEVVETIDIESADDLVYVLVQRHNNPLHTSIYDAIMTFFFTTLNHRELVRPVYEQSIIALESWLEEELGRKEQKPAFGTLVFLSLCSVPWQSSGTDNPLSWPPVLLVLVKEDTPYLQSLARMMWLVWRKKTQLHMRHAMSDWLARFELNPRYRLFLLNLFGAIIAYDRSQHKGLQKRGTVESRLLDFLRDYAARPGHPARANTIQIYNSLLETMG
jgi:glutathione S-transferase